MLEKFFPDLIAKKVQDIDLEMLKKNNIKGLILDIDNTLVPNYVKEADENTVKWIERVKNVGLQTCIVSNASKKRVIKFNERLKIQAVHKASKPRSKAFINAIELMNIEAIETAVIGDQIFTDIYGGNKLNMFTVLVSPIHKREFFLIKIKRLSEKFVFASYLKRFKRESIDQWIQLRANNTAESF